MFKIIVIAILIFSVGCLNKKESSQSTKPKTEAEKAAANLKTTQTNLKEKMNAEEANYDSILSEIETMNTERRRLRSQTVKMRAELQKTSDKSSKVLIMIIIKRVLNWQLLKLKINLKIFKMKKT